MSKSKDFDQKLKKVKYVKKKRKENLLLTDSEVKNLARLNKKLEKSLANIERIEELIDISKVKIEKLKVEGVSADKAFKAVTSNIIEEVFAEDKLYNAIGDAISNLTNVRSTNNSRILNQLIDFKKQITLEGTIEDLQKSFDVIYAQLDNIITLGVESHTVLVANTKKAIEKSKEIIEKYSIVNWTEDVKPSAEEIAEAEAKRIETEKLAADKLAEEKAAQEVEGTITSEETDETSESK